MCSGRRVVPSVRSRVAVVGDVCPPNIEKKEGEDPGFGVNSLVLHRSHHHDARKDTSTKHNKIMFFLVVGLFVFSITPRVVAGGRIRP